MIPKRRGLGDALKALLAAEVGMPVGIVRPPTTNGEPNEPPYIILDPIPGGDYCGPPFCGPEEDAEFYYQVTTFSTREDQAEWMGDKAAEVILDRSSSGQFVHALTYDDHKVMDRLPVGSPGKMGREGIIFSRADTYKFKVTSRP